MLSTKICINKLQLSKRRSRNTQRIRRPPQRNMKLIRKLRRRGKLKRRKNKSQRASMDS